MEKGLLYWILMLLWVVGGLWTPPASYTVHVGWGRSFVLLSLLLLLGWKVFGAPLQ